MKISRRTFVILLILFITFLAILSLTLVVGMLLNRASKEITYPSSNVEYTKWQLPEGAKTRLGKGTINAIKFSSDGTRFAVATTIGVWMYDAKTGNEISLLEGNRTNVLHIAFSLDGKILTGVNRKGNIVQWNTATGQQISYNQQIGKREYLHTSVISSNGMRLAGIDLRPLNKVYLSSIVYTNTEPTNISIDLETDTKIAPIIALSPDGRYLATSMSEEKNVNPIHIWNADTGERLHTFTGNKRDIEALAFSPDGTMLVSGDDNETIKVWNIDAKTSTVIYKDSYITSITFAFSPDRELLAAGNDDGNIRILKVNVDEKGMSRLVSQFRHKNTNIRHKSEITTLAFSSDGNILISGSLDGTIRGWDVATRSQLFVSPGHSVEIEGIAESSDENQILSMHGLERQIFRWDINTGYHLSGIYFSSKSPKVLSPNGETLVIDDWFSFSRNSFKLWDIPKRKKQVVLKGHNYNATASPKFVISNDGKQLASSDFYDLTGDIHLWDIENQKRSFLRTMFFMLRTTNRVHTLSGHTDRVNGMVFSPDGTMLASNGSDKRVCLWNVRSGENIFSQPSYGISGDALVFSNDSKVLASCSYNRIVLWDTTTGQQINETRTNEPVDILLFSPDNKILVSAIYFNGTIQLFDAQSLQHLSTYEGHGDDINSLLFLSDGETLVSASEDGTMLLWDWEKITQGYYRK